MTERHYCTEMRNGRAESNQLFLNVCGNKGVVATSGGEWRCKKHVPTFESVVQDQRVNTTTLLLEEVLSLLANGESQYIVFKSLADDEREYLTYLFRKYIETLESYD